MYERGWQYGDGGGSLPSRGQGEEGGQRRRLPLGAETRADVQCGRIMEGMAHAAIQCFTQCSTGVSLCSIAFQ